MRLLKYIAIFVALTPLFVSAQTVPDFPMAFWGNVTINGGVAPVGTVVRAYYGATLAGTATVQEAGVYGYTEPTKQKLVIGKGVGAISFMVQSASFNSGAETAGSSAVSHTGFTAGETIQKDLVFTITVPAPAPTTSASSGVSSSSGGSSGGGGTIITQQVVIIKGDATGDGKVDILDFNTFLIQWGKIGDSLLADFDKNRAVDILDFNWMLINWTK